MNLDSRLTDLEIKYTHQEDLLDQLNKIVAKQSIVIDRLTRELEELKITSIQSQDSIGNEKPPHY